ncbi:hypothetical protein [Pseudonocardia sp.]|uniref:hypothetical protein n=1 Tax=Pseudonocardia sp. TaxID=60912 RepID=UPI00261161B2|nr:hypothetical protein [Pseudonocardia sp.]
MAVTRLLAGIAAGAAGTTALNAVTFADMVVRARPSSTTPEDTVHVAEDATGVSLAADGPDSAAAGNRRSGLGALMGIAAGLATGAVYGLARPGLGGLPAVARGALVGVAANVATTGPMAATGVTDVREWTPDSWVSDLLPHLAYGLVTVAVADALGR